MSDRFRAFSFVDKILADETGEHVTGEYVIPETVERFPLSLVSESIGQLAAWSSMAKCDFSVRPVAGIASEVTFLSDVKPGQTLSLEADLIKADEESVNYHGVAKIDGQPVVRLTDCLGPMVPMTEFDDPEAVRQRYELLVGEGAEAGAFGGVPWFDFEKGEEAAVFQIPESAPFFNDHFPRQPVFPGTLLMDLNLRFAEETVSEISPGDWKATKVTDVKIRRFMSPGEELELSSKVLESTGDTIRILVETRRGKRLTSSARIVFEPQN